MDRINSDVLNFFVNFIEFNYINLYGFDFFKSSNRNYFKMNEFQSYLYKDHDKIYEEKYFKTIFNNYKNIKHIC